jgi:hypothetical protein
MKRYALLALPLAATMTLAACSKDSAKDTEASTSEAVASEAGATDAGATEAPSTEAAAATEAGTEAAAPSTEAAAPVTEAAAGAAAAGASLKGVCPDTVTLQTDWNPEAEHGGIYQMVGTPTFDTDKKTVTGPLMDGATDTGVKFQIRVGGPAIAFEAPSSTAVKDPSINLFYVGTDEQVNLSGQFPITAVVAPLLKNPQIIMWDPEKYPTVKAIKDLPKDVKVRVFGPGAYLSYLVNDKQITKDQIDGSYKGNPSAWVADNGKSAQQGFGSAEPFIYKNEVKEWGKDVAYQYVSDAGWDPYAAAIGVKTEELEKMKPCLKLLVPVIQRAQRDYMKDPAKTNALLIEAVTKYNTGWVYTEGVAKYSVETQIKDGLVGNSPDGTLGSFDMARVEAFIAKAAPVYKAEGGTVKDGLKAADIVTNEFIDPSIKL